MELKDYSKAELVAELIRRKVITLHTLVSLDRMEVGRRQGNGAGVVFSKVRKMRLILNLPDIEVTSGRPSEQEIADTLTAEALHANALWRFESEDVTYRF